MARGSGIRAGTLGTQLAFAMLGLLFLALFLANGLFARAGRRAVDREVARSCYQRAGWLATELENTLQADGSPTDRSRELLQRAAGQMDVSLVMFFEADEPWLTAHGPSLARSLRQFKKHPKAGTMMDSGETPWVPRFSGDRDRASYPDRNGRPVRVQEHFPFSVETPVGRRMSLRVVPLKVTTVSSAGMGIRLLFVGILLALAAMLVVGRLVHPLQTLVDGVARLGRGDTARLPAVGTGETARIGRAVNRMADQLQHAREENKRVLANVAEAFQTPAQQASSQVARLDLPAIPPSARQPIEEICQEVENLCELVGAMELWARLEAGRLELTPGADDLRALVEEAIAGRTDGDEIEVEFDVDEDVDESFELDVDLMRRAISLLLDNALQHGEAPIEVRLNRAHTKVELSIRDHGPGIEDMDQMRQAFAPFYRTVEAQGAGLRVARLVLELHRGGISMRNHPRGGLEVRLWLPAEPIRVSEVDRSLASMGWAENDVAVQFQDQRLLASAPYDLPVQRVGDDESGLDEESEPEEVEDEEYDEEDEAVDEYEDDEDDEDEDGEEDEYADDDEAEEVEDDEAEEPADELPEPEALDEQAEDGDTEDELEPPTPELPPPAPVDPLDEPFESRETPVRVLKVPDTVSVPWDMQVPVIKDITPPDDGEDDPYEPF